MSIPQFIYGTAWKENETQRLTELAITQGFRAIDTANQRKHYYEAAVGAGIAEAIASGKVKREELFLQTKFTFLPGQDDRLPYDPNAAFAEQVEQSFASSLEHLNVDSIDSYVLHGPMYGGGLCDADWQAWEAMEAIQKRGAVKHLGVSNVSLDQLRLLISKANTPPTFVQNRCFAVNGWDLKVRELCREHEIYYQGFSLLTANAAAIVAEPVKQIAAKYERTIPQIIFRFAIDVGMIPLTGTTNADHMKSDLEVFDFQLKEDELATIESIAIR